MDQNTQRKGLLFLASTGFPKDIFGMASFWVMSRTLLGSYDMLYVQKSQTISLFQGLYSLSRASPHQPSNPEI